MTKSVETKVYIPSLDRALEVGSTREYDLLDRWEFAKQAARALRHVSADSGFVVSIEGPWGSGKTSALSMIQDAFAEMEEQQPVFVSFNPWIVGEREALLRRFLTTLSTQLKLSKLGGKTQELAEAIEKYQTVFDSAKQVPGLRLKAVLAKLGLGFIAKLLKGFAPSTDIEATKEHVAKQLKKYPHKVIVFVDDIDRLYSAEVFEVIRIIKAVGDLPNVGYVLAMDSSYVNEALNHLGVPHSSTYLDKIVQTRLHIPVLSSVAKSRLINRGFESLPEAARETYFPRSDELLAMLYASGLKDILEQPRDFARLFNVVETIEPPLRREVVLSDIIAWAALTTMATPVAELLRRFPAAAIGRTPGDRVGSEKPEEAASKFKEQREKAYKACRSARAAQSITEYLFPLTAESARRVQIRSVSWQDGRLAHPSRLMIALQLAVTTDDTSINLIQRYIRNADERTVIANQLTLANCLDFIASIGEAILLVPLEPSDSVTLCGDIARTIDFPIFAERQRNREVFMPSPVGVGLRAVEKVASTLSVEDARQVATNIARDPSALSFAASIVAYAPPTEEGAERYTVLLGADDNDSLEAFGENVVLAAKDGTLFDRSEPREILKTLALKAPAHAPAVFSAIKAVQPTLVDFITTVMQGTFDGAKGQIFSRPKNESQITAYVALNDLIKHAEQRIVDSTVNNPERGAWKALIEDRSIYARDGVNARDF